MLKVKLDQQGNLLEVLDYEQKILELNESKKTELVRFSVDDETMKVINQKSKKTDFDLKKIELREKIDKKYDEFLSILNRLLEFIPQHEHNLNLGEFDEPETFIEISNNKVYQRWRKIENSEFLIQKKIESLKNMLSSTDYKIIKAYEAKLSMSDAPYTQDELDEIIAERQALRDKINELENLLNK